MSNHLMDDRRIETSIARAQALFRASKGKPRYLPDTVLLDPEDGMQMKIRRYPSVLAAMRQAKLVALIRERVHTLPFLGHRDEYLVFEYLTLDEPAKRNQLAMASQLGATLGRLSEFSPGSGEAIDFDQEFREWLDVLRGVGYISSRLQRAILQCYELNKPDQPVICLDYWDAMYHNFGFYQGMIYLLDEKHLRFSYAGVGLVKPSLLLGEDEFGAMLKAFPDGAALQFFKFNQSFLRLYYLVAALYFYALKQLDGSKNAPANSRLRYYRGALTRMLWSQPMNRFFEALIFVMRHPSAAGTAVLRRIRGPLSVRHVFDRIWLDVKAWEDDDL